MIKRADWLAVAKDRSAVILFLAVVALVITLTAVTVLRIHVSDVQVPSRFTAYGDTNIYRDQWFVQLGYPIFGLLVLAANGFLAAKIHQQRRLVSLGFLGMSVFVLIIAVAVQAAIFNLAPTL